MLIIIFAEFCAHDNTWTAGLVCYYASKTHSFHKQTCTSKSIPLNTTVYFIFIKSNYGLLISHSYIMFVNQDVKLNKCEYQYPPHYMSVCVSSLHQQLGILLTSFMDMLVFGVLMDSVSSSIMSCDSRNQEFWSWEL
jgi:hypothetical protein